MEYIKLGKNNVSRLGFGCMRLPEKNGKIDDNEALKMAEYAINNGLNYFDTAYAYHSGESEIFISKVIKAFGRDKIFIADKLPLWHCQSTSDMQRLLDEQLTKLGTDYLDYYLMHSLYDETWAKLKSFNYQDFIKTNLDNGKIKHIGFSFHDDYPLFKEIIDDYPWDFCQIQFNYVDTDYQAGLKGYEYATKKGIPIIIMEPIRGGVLASIPPSVRAIFDNSSLKKHSNAEIALKYVANYENNYVILSGMHQMSDVEENIKLFSIPLVNQLTKEELNTYLKARAAFYEHNLIKCTACHYCREGCPLHIPICKIFMHYNNQIQNPDFDNFSIYKELKPKATKCIACGTCEGVCPQKIKIIDELKRVNQYFER